MNKDEIIATIENFYCERMTELVNENQFDDAESLFHEFVVNSQEPIHWIFMENIEDVSA